MFSHILTAIDGSSHAKRAVETAARLAKQLDAKLLTICNVAGTGPIPEELLHMAEVEHLLGKRKPAAAQNVGNVIGNLATIESSSLSHEAGYEVRMVISRKILDDACRIAARLGAPAVETARLEGEPVPEILVLADKLNADLIVVGSRGLSDLKGLLLGSVSHKVCQLAKCPCLTVR